MKNDSRRNTDNADRFGEDDIALKVDTKLRRYYRDVTVIKIHLIV